MKYFLKYGVLLLIASIISCGTVPLRQNKPTSIIIAEVEEPEDKYSVVNYESEKPDEYSRFLVLTEDYTTDGGYYHKKHSTYLLGLAEVLTEKYSYNLKERSIGFYYDRLGKQTDLLYLGLDIDCSQNLIKDKSDYFKTGNDMIHEYLQNILTVTRRYDAILSESSVEGVVVGLYWFRRGRREMMTVWMSTQNIREYYNDHLTFKQMLIKSTVTDSDGKKIRLSL
ncbi:MAG: hypothetical protein PF637_02410 [Spirochaetes bacterium]|nr:hypothetical protein [Spirochaetota bacterium]